MRIIGILLFVFLQVNISLSQGYQDATFTDYFKRSGTGWNAGDGTISLGLPNGQTLWMFGDSHVDQGVSNNNELPCLFNTRNCVMIQDRSNNFTTYYDQAGTDIYTRQFIRMEGDEDITYWPAGGFVLDNIAYTFWERYNIRSSTNISFEGMVIA